MKWLFLFFISLSCQADSFIKYGLGINDRISSVKYFSLGMEEEFISVIDYKLETGLWVDTNGYPRRSSGFGAASLGVTSDGDTVFAKCFWGLAGITHTDERLSTNYQFKNDLELGVQDRRKVGVGLGYTHFSNAGARTPNLGRDIIYIKAKIGF